MPHIIIREEDNTASSLPEEEYNVVYIPGYRGVSGELEYQNPTLFKNVDDFSLAMTGSKTGDVSIISQGSESKNLSAVIAKQLLRLGMTVLYEAFNIQDVTLPADIDWDKLKDRGLYRIKYLTTGGYANYDVKDSMLACAEYRGDCIALIDHANEVVPGSGETVADAISELFKNLDAKYGAAFTPWCRFDLDEGKFELPGSFAYLSAFANSVKNNPNWYAAAGSRRGIIPNLIEPLEKFGDIDCQVLQARDITASGDFGGNDNIGVAVNPISNIRPFGYIIWGNRTLLNNTAGLIASSFLNVRNLCCDIKKLLYRAAREFTFEQNSDILWSNFCARISPLLDKALSGNGIRGYKLIKEHTDRKGCLKARIKIIPIEAVEDFDLTLELTDSIENVTENI